MLDEFKEVEETVTPLTEEQFAHLGGGSLAYVRAISSEDVARLFPQAPAAPARASAVCPVGCGRHANHAHGFT